MQIKTKKFIAREFLILVAIIGIGVITFLSTFLYNWTKSIQLRNVNDTITYKQHIIDSLAESYDAKTFKGMDYVSRIYLAFKDGAAEYNLPASNSPTLNLTEQEFRKKILFDTLYRNYVYHVLKDRLAGFTKTKSQFYNSVKNELKQIDIKQKAESTEIINSLIKLDNEKSKIESSKMNLKEQMSFTLKILLVVAFISFPIRFLYYGIKWSLKIIRT